MSDTQNPVRKAGDYSLIFVKLSEDHSQIASSISVIGAESAAIARYQEAAQAMGRATATGFVSAIA